MFVCLHSSKLTSKTLKKGAKKVVWQNNIKYFKIRIRIEILISLTKNNANMKLRNKNKPFSEIKTGRKRMKFGKFLFL